MQGDSVLPIRALARSNLQNQEWWVDGETQFCQFEHLCARICRTAGSRWVGRLGFANSSTCALEFAGPRGVVGWAKEGTLGFANSSTCALEFAEPGVVGGQGGSVLPI